MPGIPPTFLPDDAPFVDLAREYLDLLLHGDRNQAGRLILNKAEDGMHVKDIYLHVFQPTQYEIGRLWQTNRIGVAQEHFCTAAAQTIMSQLYPFVFSAHKTGRRLAAACVGGELHEIGARMLADFFEMDGWDTYYLGANTPSDAVVRTILDRETHLLCLSSHHDVSHAIRGRTDPKGTFVGSRWDTYSGGRIPFQRRSRALEDLGRGRLRPKCRGSIETGGSNARGTFRLKPRSLGSPFSCLLRSFSTNSAY